MEGSSKKVAVGVIIALVAVAGAAGGFYYKYSTDLKMKEALGVDTIYNGITVNGRNVGGMTKEEAADYLQGSINSSLSSKIITVTNGNERYNISFEDVGAQYDVDEAADSAYKAAREGTLKERYTLYEDIRENGLDIKAATVYNEEKLSAKMDELDGLITREAKDSSMTRENGRFVITEEEKGYELDTAKTRADIEKLLENGETGTVEAYCTETEPNVTKEENEMSTDLLGTFYTEYSGGPNLGRNINLVVGCNNINGTIVKPGEIFSMNESLGPQTYANGYRNAAVIVNGKLEDGLAGGVCQITTTLYNAVVKAELEIVERKNHSLAVGYVPLGHDAAIAGDYTDFKFKNNTEYPVYVEAYASDGKLVASIYGHETRSLGRTVELETVYIGSIPKPPEKVTEDPELPEGERIVTYNGKVGHKVSTYKKVSENGELISREWFSDSTYKAVADEVTVGTKPADGEALDALASGDEAAVPGAGAAENHEGNDAVVSDESGAEKPEEGNTDISGADAAESGSIFEH